MDRPSYARPPERLQAQYQHTAPPSSTHPPPYAQPPVQVPFDPFQANRDPFLPGGDRRGSAGVPSRAWPPSQGNTSAHQSPLQHPSQPPPQPLQQHQHHSQAASMSMRPPYDDHDRSRRSSLGHAGSPQYGGQAPPPPPPSYPARNMPPPSSPQSAPSSAHLTSAPRGPPTASPFGGIRDLASNHHRPGMSISAILGGGGDERRPPGSPHGSVHGPSSTSRSMQPPSPGRARSSSMRESGDRETRRTSPPRTLGGPSRMGSEPRRERGFESPQFRREPAHNFRAYQPQMQEQSQHTNGNGAPIRPSSQPAEADRLRGLEEATHRESLFGSRVPGLRYMGEAPSPAASEPPFRHERPQFHTGVTSHPQDRPVFNSPQMERNRNALAPVRYAPPGGMFGGAPAREDPSPLFRAGGYPNVSYSAADAARESIEGRTQEMRRQHTRASPPPNDLTAYDRPRTGLLDRPVTLEDHQRIETLQRDQQRKESDSSVHKAILNISPELNRRGRNSPLPQAVQGAQPRHVGPGGDNPGIKMEFGRMFSGLGSGVGSTPNPTHPANGVSTPSRMSPASRLLDGGDLRRSVEVDPHKGRGKAGSRLGRRNNGRRSRDEIEDAEGSNAPDAQRGNKRTKTGTQNHHHHHHAHPHPHPHAHHHHHHHVEGSAPGNGASVSRHPSSALSQPNLATGQTHHHHHHHPHPIGHHHHHPPRSAPAPRKPTMTIINKKVLDEVAGRPRKHLGTHLYTTELSPAPAADTPLDAKIRYSSKMKPIPVMTSQENCTYTIRVPRYYLTSGEGGAAMNHSLEEICKRRQIWGTEIYTDDSDVIAAAIHSGWIKGDFGEYNNDLRDICDNAWEHGSEGETPLSLVTRPQRPIKAPEGYDAHVTLLILPPLEFYAATSQHHLASREWKKKHDGMSYMIHSIEFVDEGPSNRFVERSAAARKNRIAVEEAARKEAAAGLLLFASGGSSSVRVGA